jgi:hypothetical protein
MIWLLSKLFGQVAEHVAPLFHFIGDHRYGAIALLFVAVAAASWAYLPVVGARTAKILLIVAIAFATFDWGYSHRAAIDREAWNRAESLRLAAEVAERARRDFVLDKTRRDAEATDAALKSQQEEHARYMVEMENASKANDRNPCLDGAGVMRIDRIGRRKKAR